MASKSAYPQAQVVVPDMTALDSGSRVALKLFLKAKPIATAARTADAVLSTARAALLRGCRSRSCTNACIAINGTDKIKALIMFTLHAHWAPAPASWIPGHGRGSGTTSHTHFEGRQQLPPEASIIARCFPDEMLMVTWMRVTTDYSCLNLDIVSMMFRTFG